MKLKDLIGTELFSKLSENIQKEYKEKDLILNDGSFIPKERFDQVNSDKKEYKRQLEERDTQLEGLKTKVKDNEDLTKEIETLKNLNLKTTSEYEEKIKIIKFDSALNNALKSTNTKNIKALKALLDLNKVKFEDETLIGLNEQLETIKKENDYLFNSVVNGTGEFNTGQNKQSDSNNNKNISLGEKLAKEKTDQIKASETLDSFFK